MHIQVSSMTVEYDVTCERCGASHFIVLDEGDFYVSEEQCIEALLDSGELNDWVDGVCPDCIEEEEENN